MVIKKQQLRGNSILVKGANNQNLDVSFIFHIFQIYVYPHYKHVISSIFLLVLMTQQGKFLK